MGKPHVVAVPYPAQGHVIPLLELCQCLVEHGFQVTFVNTEYNHNRVMNSLVENNKYVGDYIHLVSIPDGLEPWEDRNELGKLINVIQHVMPGKLEKLIKKINGSEGNKVSCVIADMSQAWPLEVADKMKIPVAAFWPASAASLAMSLNIPKMISDGVCDHEGKILKKQSIQLAPNVPTIKTEHLYWCIGDSTTQNLIFQEFLKTSKGVKLADWIICNSSQDLEPAAFDLKQGIIPIGPIFASTHLEKSTGNFWPVDSSCLKWLDKQEPRSVIYVAFGSFTVFDQVQFQELALGLEQTGMPFLWVVRPDITDNHTDDAYPDGFVERVGSSRGRMVGWSPQRAVLRHPSIACFVSHCGWNSTIEGVSNGLPFLCWPYFGDQFTNEGYICDVWEVGLKFDRDENGIIRQMEINEKVEKLVGDEELIARAVKLKERVMHNMGKGGGSDHNLKDFINLLKT